MRLGRVILASSPAAPSHPSEWHRGAVFCVAALAGESASLGAEEPPAMPDDASDLWSQSGDGQPAQEDEGEEDEAEAGASQEAAKPKGKAPKAPPASRLPFVLAPKVRRDILLFESTDASLGLSGDSGTIGRLRVHSTAGGGKSGGGVAGGSSSAAPHGEHALTLDLKGKASRPPPCPSPLASLRLFLACASVLAPAWHHPRLPRRAGLRWRRGAVQHAVHREHRRQAGQGRGGLLRLCAPRRASRLHL